MQKDETLTEKVVKIGFSQDENVVPDSYISRKSSSTFLHPGGECTRSVPPSPRPSQVNEISIRSDDEDIQVMGILVAGF